jgi:hypothetical protein
MQQEENFKIIKSNLPEDLDEDYTDDLFTKLSSESEPKKTGQTNTSTSSELSRLQQIGVLSSHKYTVRPLIAVLFLTCQDVIGESEMERELSVKAFQMELLSRNSHAEPTFSQHDQNDFVQVTLPKKKRREKRKSTTPSKFPSLDYGDFT